MPGIPFTDDEFKLYVVEQMTEHGTLLKGIKGDLAAQTKKIKQVEDESNDRDDALAEKIQASQTRMAWISGAGSMLGAVIGFLLRGRAH